MGKPVVTAGESQLLELLGMQPRPARPALTIGQVLDDTYRIEGEIGAGGMGRVYRACDTALGRDVAIKLHTIGASTSQRLVREAAALARLAHPNVVTVHAVGDWAGHPWVAMEYVPGGTARDWLERTERTPQDIVALYCDAALGLAAAHEVGLVHRDFKPDNVLVGRDDRPRVADFGLVREIGAEGVVSLRSSDGEPDAGARRRDGDLASAELGAGDLASAEPDAGARRRDGDLANAGTVVGVTADTMPQRGAGSGRGIRGRARTPSSGGEAGAIADPNPAVAVRTGSFGNAATALAMSSGGLVVGTPAYMAPEQWTGRDVTPAADQFALALSLWEALTGARPFAGDSGAELLKHMRRPIPPPPAGKVPRHVERALRRALSFEPAQRWPSMAALVAELRPPPRRSRLPWIAAGAAVAGAAALVLVLARGPGAADDDCAREIGLPSPLAVALAAEHGRSARVDGEATARRIHNVADALRGEDRRLATGCSEDPARRAAERACRAHAGRVATLLFTYANTLPPSEALPLVLDHPQLAACAPPHLSPAAPLPEPAAARAIAALDAARVFADHGALATARGLAAAVADDPIASDPVVARRLELARAAIAIAAAAGPPPIVGPAATDDAATTLIAQRLAIARAAQLRDRAGQRSTVASAMRDVERLAAAAPEEAYRTAAAAVLALDAQWNVRETVELYARLAPLAIAPPIAYEDAALAHLHSQEFVSAPDAIVNGKRLLNLLVERYGAAHPRAAAAQLRLSGIPTLVRGPIEQGEPHRARLEALAKLTAADDAGRFIATALAEHGGRVMRQDRFEEAEPYLLAGRRGLVATFGADHISVALIDLDRVHGLLARRDLAAAEALALRAEQSLTALLGPEHPLVGTAVDNRAVAVRGRGDLAAALELWRRFVAITGAHAGDDAAAATSYDRARIELGRTHVLRGDWQIALDTLEPVVKALAKLDQHDEAQAAHVAVGSFLAGRCFFELGRYRAARSFLERSIHGFSSTLLGPRQTDEVRALLARIPPDR